MKTRFIADASVQFAYRDGRVVTVSHRKGDEVELADDLGQLFIAQGSAIRITASERAVRKRGETR